MATWSVDPFIAQLLTVATLDVDLHVVARHSVESGREHDHVECVLAARGSHAGRRDLLDWINPEIDELDVVAIEGLVVAAITQRSPGVQVVGRERFRGLRILHDLFDLAADECRCCFVRDGIDTDVSERREHVAEATADVPGFLEDTLALVLRHAHRRHRALSESERSNRLADAVPVAVVVGADPRQRRTRDRAVLRRHAVLRAPLEDDQLLDLRCHFGDQLYTAGACSDYADTLADQVEPFERPTCRVVGLSREGVDPFVVGIDGG